MSRGVWSPSFQAADWFGLLRSLLATLVFAKTQEAYRTAILDFLTWLGSSSKPLVASTVEAWRATLVQRGLAPSSGNQLLSTLRVFLRHAQEHGFIGAREAAEFRAFVT